jgi:hypothetical protein
MKPRGPTKGAIYGDGAQHDTNSFQRRLGDGAMEDKPSITKRKGDEPEAWYKGFEGTMIRTVVAQDPAWQGHVYVCSLLRTWHRLSMTISTFDIMGPKQPQKCSAMLSF